MVRTGARTARTTDTLNVPCKGIWDGKVAIQNTFVRQAISENLDLVIFLLPTKEQMRIPLFEIQSRQAAWSTRKYRDKWRRPGKDYYLIYYWWIPDFEQGRLIV